ncbi:hypothetical protein JJC00_07845 [Bradyrhizobium diazoefficiens]|uniref:maleate cis-trans isomerase family protein n=1 Tax=Bradyrhizobium diazoefficiens TaxID=1355477 RepID=UPI00190D8B6A|nr:hypothetical protein [Bradyrhizobium diazoefficiens]QQO35532.1 hypothetical protein JJC00_07845 [Bradyrhizobium diazoefficiens]
MGGADNDYPRLVNDLFPDGSVIADIAYTTYAEANNVHTIEALIDTGARWRLGDGAITLKSRDADVAVWACTSGSFVFGLNGAQRQVDELAEDFGGPASSTSLAFVRALDALDIDEVAVAASYPEGLTRPFLDLLQEAGHHVVGGQSHGIMSGPEVSLLSEDEVLEFVRAADHPRAKAILVPDTAMRTVGGIARFEAAVAKPVLTANQVTVWEALRLLGAVPYREGAGSLFTGTPPASSNVHR